MAATANPVVLLGAGASREANIPMSLGMTEALRAQLQSNEPFDGALRAFNFVCAALSAYDASRGQDPTASLDVESVFDAIGALARRQGSELAAFVSGWNPAVDEFDKGPPWSVFDFHFRDALNLSKQSRNHTEIRELIRTLVREEVYGTGQIYGRLGPEMVQQVSRLILGSQGDVGYLRPLARAGKEDGGLTIATLNYDLTIESICEEEGVAHETRIEHWSKTGTWDWPPTTEVRLLKLHGSIDWIEADQADFAPGQLRSTTVRPPRAFDRENAMGARALIFGHSAKLRPDGPFLSLLAAFEKELALADRLVVIGYSFRDPHIDEVIRRWFTEDPSRRLDVVDPYFPDQASGSTPPSLRDELIMAFDPEFWKDHGDVVMPDRFTPHRKDASAAISELFDSSVAGRP